MNFGLEGSLSSAVLQSTDCSMILHLRSMSESIPLYTGEPADRAAKMGVKGRS